MTCSFSALDGLYYITNCKISQEFLIMGMQKYDKNKKIYYIYKYTLQNET